MKAINKTILDVKEGNLEIGERDLTLMKKVHRTAVISTLNILLTFVIICHQGLDNEDLFEFEKDMEKLDKPDINKIQETANTVLNNPTIHILKS